MKFSDEELTTRLRSLSVVVRHAAAERIEQLVKESNRRLDLARSEGVARVIQFERAEAAEAKLAKAVEALRKLITCVDDGCYCSEMQMASTMDDARAVLAELEETE